jgi:transcription termination factor Rho
MALKDMHLADLHERARELDLPSYRMLTRDELIDAIEREGGGKAKPARTKAKDREKPKDRERAKDRDKPKDGERAKDREREDEEVETEEVTGVLDRMPQGYGFLRLVGFEPAEGDVYVSASQIRRCELRPGDEVSGPARAPRRGEKHRALVRVGSVNGGDPEGERTHFEDLTPKAPHREIAELGSMDSPDPIAYGNRVLVLAGEAEDASEQLRDAAGDLAKAGASLTVLLAGPAAEDAGAWEKAARDADLVGGSEMEPRDRVRAAELAVGRAKRRAEGGEDAVVLIDSLSSLAEGYRDVSRVKRLFGAGRELAEEGTGSLTVFAALVRADERAEDVESALSGTEDVLLDRG